MATWGPSSGWSILGSHWGLVCPGVPVGAGQSLGVPVGAGLSSGVPVGACFLVLGPGVSFPRGVTVRATFPLDGVLCTGKPVRGLGLASRASVDQAPSRLSLVEEALCQTWFLFPGSVGNSRWDHS